MSTTACRTLLGASKRQPTAKLSNCCVQLPSAGCAAVNQTRASSSNSRWKARQGKDIFAREAKVQGLKSRAAFKLLEMDVKYRIFRKGQTVVDLGYAPGSWSQVAADRTKPYGKVLGIDIIPAQPPKGVSTIQGNFLSPDVQAMVKDHLVRHKDRKGPAGPPSPSSEGEESESTDDDAAIVEDQPSYIDMERTASEAEPETAQTAKANEGRLVNVRFPSTTPTPKEPNPGFGKDSETDRAKPQIVLSDMSAPWDQTTGFGVNSLSNPHHRMMNTSGITFRDHAGSMDLCNAALQFASDTLKNGGHFVCKFYQGSEDKAFEQKLKQLFVKVHREKPESSRRDSKEAYFVALKRKGSVTLEELD
ncbi:cell division cycle protein [Colletotrichum karsti]|uniref:rRNA methyltransferase 2, mitochondrial n=1 Tax=Colletotrichum karsti TaxID=1095194 RepID=A0A9P6IFI8_9PEZI|nr:cell division cycle protein [Colletotrichum karsti]KAF9882447.1 cell division cycle protein [Colletotrichum karsti]